MQQRVEILGVEVENPTIVWTELMNTRRRVLNRRTAWNPGGWYDDSNGFSMCLANALRFVVHGSVNNPTVFSRDVLDMDVAEKLVLAVANEGGSTYSDIPEFNDTEGRTFEEVKATLDRAIELLRPYVTSGPVVIAEAIMSDAENAEMRKEIRRVEDEMWDEWVRSWGLTTSSDGRVRDKDGRFAALPKRGVRRQWAKVTRQFNGWLEDHEARGWSTFWDELEECDENDKKCQERKRKASLV